MENRTIVKLNSLEASYAAQTAALLVDCFYSMFQGISRDREILRRLFLPSLQLDLFYVLIQNDQIAGFIAISDSNRRAIIIHEAACTALFGPVKGKLLARQLWKLFSVPAVSGQRQGYIDFIATAPEYKRCGVAAALLTRVEQAADFSQLYLDVLPTNHGAICLYEKMGYTVESTKKNIWMRLAGIKAMNLMKKEWN